MYNDYSKAENIKHTWLRWPCIRVSTARIPSMLSENASFGEWYETWIFSDCPFIRTIQRTFKTEKEAVKAHGHIVNNIKQILQEVSHGKRKGSSQKTKEV